MKRVRTRLVEWTSPVLAVFLAAVATPRAGLFFHHHADGDHAHVHADDDEDHHHLAESYDDHHHHDHEHAAVGAEEEPEIEAPDHEEMGHWHSQNRFHRALAPALITVPGIQLIDLVRGRSEYPAADRPALPAHARGPPLAA